MCQNRTGMAHIILASGEFQAGSGTLRHVYMMIEGYTDVTSRVEK